MTYHNTLGRSLTEIANLVHDVNDEMEIWKQIALCLASEIRPVHPSPDVLTQRILDASETVRTAYDKDCMLTPAKENAFILVREEIRKMLP